MGCVRTGFHENHLINVYKINVRHRNRENLQTGFRKVKKKFLVALKVHTTMPN